jgi:hypothetical protein
MNRQPEPEIPDDVRAAVRDLASSWHLPAAARDRSGWQDRIRPERDRPRSWAAWGRRLAAAAALALTVTAMAALVAVWLAMPPSGPSASGINGPSFTPRPTPNPALLYSAPPTATPLPTLPAYVLFGTPMPLGRVLVSAGSGPALLDLNNGTLTTVDPTAGLGNDQVFALPEGGFLCACVTSVGTYDPPTTSTITTTTVTLRWLGEDGATLRSLVLPTYVGRSDPSLTGDAPGSAVSTSLDPEGGTLYVGWAVERPPLWHGGIDEVDLGTGQVVGTIPLPDVSDAAGGQPQALEGATVAIAPDGAAGMISRTVWYPNGGTAASWHAASPIRRGQLGLPIPLRADAAGLDGAPCVSTGGPGGFATASIYYEVCYGDNGAIVRRVDQAGRPLGDTALDGSNGVEFALGTVVDQARHLLYAWDPFGARLERIDLATGRITGSTALPTPTALNDPLTAVAQALAGWLAPTTLAKDYLSPSLAISADGSRLYALGTAAIDPTSPAGGSTGVWIFDTSSLAIVGHWAPLADYISLTIADGGLILAAGMPGVDASGVQNDRQGASVVAYDPATGAVRIVAGQVQGSSAGWVLFPAPDR